MVVMLQVGGVFVRVRNGNWCFGSLVEVFFINDKVVVDRVICLVVEYFVVGQGGDMYVVFMQ